MISVSPSRIIAKYLLDLGHISATGPEWKYSIDSMPDVGDQFVTIQDTTAVTDGKIMRSGETILHYGLMLMLRSKTHVAAWTKGSSIQNALDSVRNNVILVDGKTFKLRSFVLTSPFTKIGVEEKNIRLLFTINGISTISEVS